MRAHLVVCPYLTSLLVRFLPFISDVLTAASSASLAFDASSAREISANSASSSDAIACAREKKIETFLNSVLDKDRMKSPPTARAAPTPTPKRNKNNNKLARLSETRNLAIGGDFYL
jgi:hypothetical protein